jgi:hypothetical protein
MLKKKLQNRCRLEFDRLDKIIGYPRHRPHAAVCAC